MSIKVKALGLCIILLSVSVLSIMADEYVVKTVMGDGDFYIVSRVGKKKIPIKRGVIFDEEKDSIVWTNTRQSFRAVNLKDKSEYGEQVFAASKAKKERVGFLEYLVGNGLKKPAGGKGLDDIGEIRRDSFLLLDTVVVRMGYLNPNACYEAVWDDGEIVKATLGVSFEKNEIYFTPAVFCGRKPHSIEVKIMAVVDDETVSFSYCARTIWIEPIP